MASRPHAKGFNMPGACRIGLAGCLSQLVIPSRDRAMPMLACFDVKHAIPVTRFMDVARSYFLSLPVMRGVCRENWIGLACPNRSVFTCRDAYSVWLVMLTCRIVHSERRLSINQQNIRAHHSNLFPYQERN